MQLPLSVRSFARRRLSRRGYLLNCCDSPGFALTARACPENYLLLFEAFDEGCLRFSTKAAKEGIHELKQSANPNRWFRHEHTISSSCELMLFPLRTFCRHQSSRVMAGVMKHVTDYVISKPAGRLEGPVLAGNRHQDSSLMLLVLLNYHLPRFTPQLWSRGNQSFHFSFINSPVSEDDLGWALTRCKQLA